MINNVKQGAKRPYSMHSAGVAAIMWGFSWGSLFNVTLLATAAWMLTRNLTMTGIISGKVSCGPGSGQHLSLPLLSPIQPRPRPVVSLPSTSGRLKKKSYYEVTAVPLMLLFASDGN